MRARKFGLVGVVKEALDKIKTDLTGRTVIVQHLAGRGYAFDPSGSKVMADPDMANPAQRRRVWWMDALNHSPEHENIYLQWHKWLDDQRAAIDLIRSRGAKACSYEACPAYLSRDARHARLIELADMGVSEAIYDRTANVGDYRMWKDLKADADSLRLPIMPEGMLDSLDSRTGRCMVLDNGNDEGAAYNVGKPPNAGWDRVDIIGLNLPKVTSDDIKYWDAKHKRPAMRYSIGAGQYDAVVGGMA